MFGKMVYAEYIQKSEESCSDRGVPFRKESLPAERTLQDASRSALDGQGPGTSDEGAGLKVTLQCEDTLQRVKTSDGHAQRNMSRFRESIVSGNLPSRATTMTYTDGEVPGGDKSKACESKSGEDSKSYPGGRRETSLEVQTRVADGINRMADTMEITEANNATLIKEEVAFAKTSNLHVSARRNQKGKMHDLELRNSKLETRKK